MPSEKRDTSGRGAMAVQWCLSFPFVFLSLLWFLWLRTIFFRRGFVTFGKKVLSSPVNHRCPVQRPRQSPKFHRNVPKSLAVRQRSQSKAYNNLKSNKVKVRKSHDSPICGGCRAISFLCSKTSEMNPAKDERETWSQAHDAVHSNLFRSRRATSHAFGVHGQNFPENFVEISWQVANSICSSLPRLAVRKSTRSLETHRELRIQFQIVKVTTQSLMI